MAVPIEDLRVIETDTHVDLWTSPISVKRCGDRVPRVPFNQQRQKDVWHAGDTELGDGEPDGGGQSFEIAKAR